MFEVSSILNSTYPEASDKLIHSDVRISVLHVNRFDNITMSCFFSAIYCLTYLVMVIEWERDLVQNTDSKKWNLYVPSLAPNPRLEARNALSPQSDVFDFDRRRLIIHHSTDTDFRSVNYR